MLLSFSPAVDGLVVLFRLLSGSSLGFFTGGEPEALAAHFQDVDVVRQANQQRAGEPLEAEHRGPLPFKRRSTSS